MDLNLSSHNIWFLLLSYLRVHNLQLTLTPVVARHFNWGVLVNQNIIILGLIYIIAYKYDE